MEPIETVGWDAQEPEVNIEGKRLTSVYILAPYPSDKYLISIDLSPRGGRVMTVPDSWAFHSAHSVNDEGQRFYPLGRRFVDEVLEEHDTGIRELIGEYCERLAGQEDALRRAA